MITQVLGGHLSVIIKLNNYGASIGSIDELNDYMDFIWYHSFSSEGSVTFLDSAVIKFLSGSH